VKNVGDPTGGDQSVHSMKGQVESVSARTLVEQLG